jgi:tetratricopeptide (TPR) repeat protein
LVDTDMREDASASNGLDAGLLLRLAAQWLLEDPDPEAFLRHMALRGPVLFPEALTEDPDEVRRHPASKVLRADAPQFFRGLGWTIASAMPLPSNDWRPRKLPLPGRNEACLCGSLHKFKHCCARLMEKGPRLDPVWLGALVVMAMPAKAWAGLPGTRVSPDTVAAAANELAESDRPREAVKLLEPWAQLPAPWPASRLELLDLLADLYLELGHPRKRKALADKLVRYGDKAVQSLGWQRLSMMASDAGDVTAARQAFEQAQRLTPDEPRVALLEVTTLLADGALERAHERAAFHARRLGRLPQAAELAPQIEGLQAIARGELDHVADGHRAPFDDGPVVADEFAPLAFLTDLHQRVLGLPPARLQLDLARSSPDDLGELRPARSQRAALARWREQFDAPGLGLTSLHPGTEPGLRALDGGTWQRLLADTPSLLNQFEVLDGLVNALQAVPFGLAADLEASLMARALDLWALLRARFPTALVEWGWLDNRPALRLLVRHVLQDHSPRADTSFEHLHALVEVLNPNDNHGLRERLGAVLLRRGETAAALALAQRYPDDYVGMRLLHVRALLGLQRLEAAQLQFSQAVADNPYVVKLLCSSRAPRVPDAPSYRMGSPEHAKIVVANQHDLWRDKSLQAWLKAQVQAGGKTSADQLTLI